MRGRDRPRRAVFLDRDGVLNRALVRDGRPFAPLRLSEFVVLPGAAEAVGDLRRLGLVTIVVTNQKDVARGLLDGGTLQAMHDDLRAQVEVDDIRCCTCRRDCPCYKPKPGMLLDAARDWGVSTASSFLVGDRWRDIGAGRAAGCTTLFIDHGYDEPLVDPPDHVVADLGEAVARITALLTPEV